MAARVDRGGTCGGMGRHQTRQQGRCPSTAALLTTPCKHLQTKGAVAGEMGRRAPRLAERQRVVAAAATLLALVLLVKGN